MTVREALQLGEDLCGEDLAEFHSPLVEAVDVPDGSLGEDGVFVEGDELAEDGGGERVGEDDVRRAVALEDAVRDEPFGRALGADLLGGLAEGECLGLGEDVGHQHVVVAAERVQRLAKPMNRRESGAFPGG